MATYYRRPWADARGDAYDAWGCVTYYFETDDKGAVIRQVEDYEDGPTLRYDVQHSEDEFGFLTDQPFDREEVEPYITTKAVFETAWMAGS